MIHRATSRFEITATWQKPSHFFLVKMDVASSLKNLLAPLAQLRGHRDHFFEDSLGEWSVTCTHAPPVTPLFRDVLSYTVTEDAEKP